MKLPIMPVAIGFILGPIFEKNLRRAESFMSSGPKELLNHPLALVILVVTVVMIVYSLRSNSALLTVKLLPWRLLRHPKGNNSETLMDHIFRFHTNIYKEKGKFIMKKITRRSFLAAMGIVGASAALTACGAARLPLLPARPLLPQRHPPQQGAQLLSRTDIPTLP